MFSLSLIIKRWYGMIMDILEEKDILRGRGRFPLIFLETFLGKLHTNLFLLPELIPPTKQAVRQQES